VPRKTKEGSQHPDRDAQFRHINDRVAAAITQDRPAISSFDRRPRGRTSASWTSSRFSSMFTTLST
jgi:hypothetical protein